jgi:hypothetical protein
MTSPRSSPLLTWSDCHKVTECGGKAFGLAQAAEVVSVPWFLVVPAPGSRMLAPRGRS